MKFIFLISTLVLVFSGCVTGNVTFGGDDDYETIPVSEITNVLQKYTYNHNGVEIRYFAVLDLNNEIKVAFDACEVCGGRLGYTQSGNDVVCSSCGLNFPITNLGTANRGEGCWPSYLSFRVEDGNVLISQAELANGAYHFT